ncbi:hypothetical protein LTS10_005045 [Elasticomyces elasticus]|nr:hypothetical protein LTS10_005045 [Elasticomyces elasticus]
MGRARIARCRKGKEKNEKGLSLLRLPAELRNEITQYCVDDVHEVHISADGTINVPSLAQTCRQLRYETIPMWKARYISTPMHLECFVHNFDFDGVHRALCQISEEARVTVAEEQMLTIRLHIDHKHTCKTGLKHWLKSYAFAGALAEASTFKGLEDAVEKAFPIGSERLEWARIIRCYDAALLRLHKSLPQGGRNYWEREIGRVCELYEELSTTGSLAMSYYLPCLQPSKASLQERFKEATAALNEQGWMLTAVLSGNKRGVGGVEGGVLRLFGLDLQIVWRGA